MIPRSVKAWLFLYGLFFGSVIGGIFGIFALTLDIAFYSLLALVAGSLLLLGLIEWRKKEVVEKWLPTLHEKIGLIDLLKKIVGRDRANSTKKKTN